MAELNSKAGEMIERLDHLVVPVRSLEETCRFYCEVLGMRREVSDEGRVALHFGRQKINLHQDPSDVVPRAIVSKPGSADLCFVTEWPLNDVVRKLQDTGVEIEMGPMERLGALGTMTSIYLRDPDHNLIEISSYTTN